jgi:hypothetical protein
MQELSDAWDFAQFLQTNAGRMLFLVPACSAFCNYRHITPVALDNREIREHAGTGNKPARQERHDGAAGMIVRGRCGPKRRSCG